MNQGFETPEMKSIMIETLNYAGSAFGVTTEGDQVFVNKRIVETVQLEEGLVVKALLLPNYADKRDNIPWRAIRVERDGVERDAPAPAPEPEPEISKAELIAELIEEHGPLRTSAIAKHLGLTMDETSTLCLGLFAAKTIAMAEVYTDPTQKRASLRVWGSDVNDFDIDIEP